MEKLNYSELCHQLGEKERTGGRNRKLHIESLQEQYNIEKVGYGKYTIRGQYTAEEKQLIQAEKNYNNFVQATLLNLFAEGDVVQTHTYTSFRKGLYMVNTNYFLYKYGKENIDIKLPKDFPAYLAEEFEDRWFNIVEAHDKYVLKSNLLKLKEKGFIEYNETYLLYKAVKYEDGKIYSKGQIATTEEWAEIEQTKLEFMKDNGAHSIQELYQLSPQKIKQYYAIILAKVKNLGYDNYAKAFIISRPSGLKKMVGFFAPKFNKAQVDRLLKSRRFKMIPPLVHEQMIDKTIKITPEVFVTADKLTDNSKGE